MKQNPLIRRHLLWEYDWQRLDFHHLAIVVIERVIERGNFQDWKELIRFYGKSKIQEVCENSTRLDKKCKNFTPIFLQSDLIN